MRSRSTAKFHRQDRLDKIFITIKCDRATIATRHHSYYRYFFTMKKLFSLFLSTILFNSAATVTHAQNNSTCFMLDADGDRMNLGYLCQSKPKPNPSNWQTPPPQSNSQPGVHIVPIKGRRSGIPVIDVKFNDRYTFEMMLDTGASSIVITRQMAKKLRVNHTESVWVSTPSNDYFKMSSGYVYSVGVAGITQKNSRVITSPSLDMGLLGQSFFNHYDITIKRDVVEFRER